MVDVLSRSTSFVFDDHACVSGYCENSDPSYALDVELESWKLGDRMQPAYIHWVEAKREVIDVGPIGYLGWSGIYFAPRSIESPLHLGYSWYARHNLTEVNVNFPLVGTLDLAEQWGNSSEGFCGHEWNLKHPLPDGQWCTNGTYIPPQCVKPPERCRELYHGNILFDTGVVEMLVRNHGLPYVVAYTQPTFRQVLER
jgi:hypothetical protein